MGQQKQKNDFTGAKTFCHPDILLTWYCVYQQPHCFIFDSKIEKIEYYFVN